MRDAPDITVHLHTQGKTGAAAAEILAAAPGIRLISRSCGRLRAVPAAMVQVVDLGNPGAFTDYAGLETVGGRAAVVVLARGPMRQELWMARSCGVRGHVEDTATLPATIRTVVAGGSSWPSGMGAAPGWLHADLPQRILAYASARERSRFDRIIHDKVLQTLEGLALMLAVDGDRMAGQVRQEAQMLRRLIDPPQTTSGDLTTELEALLQSFAGPLPPARLVMTDGAAPTVAPAIREALVGAVGEALRNVIKHARASAVTVELKVTDAQVEVRVSDDGQGFDVRRLRGYGLAECIQARMAEAGGRSRICSRPGVGTTVELIAAATRVCRPLAEAFGIPVRQVRPNCRATAPPRI